VYDDLGRPTQRTLPDPDGEGELTAAVWDYAYDAAGNVTSETDPLGNVTSYVYDDLNRPISVTDPNSGETTFTYDAAGNRVSLTDPVANTTTWVYDGLNRVTEETNELNDSRLFEYDAMGHLMKRTDRNGRVIEYTFDDMGRQTAELWKDGETTVRTISFEYNAASQLTGVTDPDADYTYIYDDLGRTTAIVVTIAGLTPSVGLDQAFDAAGNRTQAAFAFGTTDDMVNDYTYDDLGRVTRIDQSSPQSGNTVAEKRIDLAYDAASRWNTIARYADVAGTDLVVESSWTYDNASRLTALTHVKDTTTLADYSWSFDSTGRVSQFDSATDGTVDYTYDDTNQLTGADYDYQTDESYSYDANGNRTTTGYSTGDDNRLTSDGAYAYTYDAEGNRTARFVDEDASGTLNTGDTDITEYTWDYRNRLTKVTERATFGGSATKATDFAYDYLNRLVSESADPDGAGEQGAEERYFAYDGNQIALEFDGTESSDLAHRYLWGPAVDQILSDEQVTSLNNRGEVLWPLADNLGTVRDLATYDSQEDETTVPNHRVFDAYGNITSETNSAVDHLFGFTGRQFDESTGVQNNLNRWYDRAVGRWLGQDPIGFGAGDRNLHRYVGNRPTNSIDPTGLAEPLPAEFWEQYWRAMHPRTEPVAPPPVLPIGMSNGQLVYPGDYVPAACTRCHMIIAGQNLIPAEQVPGYMVFNGCSQVLLGLEAMYLLVAVLIQPGPAPSTPPQGTPPTVEAHEPWTPQPTIHTTPLDPPTLPPGRGIGPYDPPPTLDPGRGPFGPPQGPPTGGWWPPSAGNG
jgi:RHS repeat-associated protein